MIFFGIFTSNLAEMRERETLFIRMTLVQKLTRKDSDNINLTTILEKFTTMKKNMFLKFEINLRILVYIEMFSLSQIN